MQVRLLKKSSSLQFVAQSLSSNAILRFETRAPTGHVAGEVLEVTNCVFTNTSKIVLCDALPAELSIPLNTPPPAKRQRPALAALS